MKQIFSIAFFFTAATLLAAPPAIQKLNYPAKIRTGEKFRIEITASEPRNESLTYYFNGERKETLPNTQLFTAKDYAAKYSFINPDGAVTSKTNYHTLVHIPLQEYSGKKTVWVLASGGSLCLKNRQKELKWHFGKKNDSRWINFGQYDSKTLGKELHLMTEKPPFANVLQVLLTEVSPKEYHPQGVLTPPNVFYWVPEKSAIGKQKFIAGVSCGKEKNSKTILVDVLPCENSKQKKTVRIPVDQQKRIPLKQFSADPRKYPLFAFQSPEYRKKLQDNPLGLNFSADSMIPLRCNTYKDLPQTVEIPVNGKAAALVFLLTQYWQGDVGQEMAHFIVNYTDGAKQRIPLREEFELCGSLRNREPQAAIYAGTVSTTTEFNLTLLPWFNPEPEKEIRSLTFSNQRMAVSKEENKIIPLNVTSESSQILLGMTLLAPPAAKQLEHAVPRVHTEQKQVSLTINFAEPKGKISPNLFSTNETDVLSSDSKKFDEYLKKMKSVNCRLYRFHSGWNLAKIYPEQLKNPRYEKLILTISKIKKTNPEWDVMMCFNSIPSYVDPETKDGRRLFAALCADLVRELNIKQKFGLKYWEIYNEVYFKKIEEDRALWKMYNEAAAAMRKVDPAIKIGGYAPCWPVLSNIRDFYQHCHKETDFISYHKYLTGSVKTPTEYLMKQTKTFGDDARKIRAIAEKITPGKKIELALTEYNINFNWKPHDPRQATIEGAVWFASVLNHLIQADVEIAQTWHSKSGGTFGLFSDQNEPRPAAAFFALANRYLKGNYYPANSTSENIECLAFKDQAHTGMLVINKTGKKTDIKLQILNKPEFVEDPVLPDSEEFSLTAGSLSAKRISLNGRNEFAFRMNPFEIKLLRLKRQVRETAESGKI